MDISGLQAAINERVKYLGRTSAEVVNNAAFWVAYNTAKNTPFTSIGKITTELGVTVNPILGKRGRFLKVTKKNSRMEGKAFGSYRTEVPLAALIIQARSNRLSKYSFLTNGRYFSESPFKGKSRLDGAIAMEGAISRMIKARRSSIKFLASGWKKAVETLFSYKGRGSAPTAGMFSTGTQFGDRGSVIVAQEGGATVMAMISNNTGLEGKNAINVNRALWVYGLPPLQAAIDREEVQMLKYMIEKTKKQNEKFNAMCR